MVEKNNMDLFSFLTLMLCIPLIGAQNTDCNSRSFHCVNSTHFMICVDVGGGVSMTISSFVLQCPPTTFCLETNNFECEFQTPTTQKSIIQKNDVTTEFIVRNATTTTYGDNVLKTDSLNKENTFVLPLQKYSIATTNKNLDENMTDSIPSSKLRLVVKNEAVNKNETESKDNLNNKLKPEVVIDLNKTNKIVLQSLDPKPEYEQIVNNIIEDANTKVKLSHDDFTTEIIPSEVISNFSSVVTKLNSSDYYNSEDSTQNNIIINSTENLTNTNLINNTENNLFTDASENNKSTTAEMIKETTELNIFFNDSQPDKLRDTTFISTKSFANSTLKESDTMAFPSNFSFIGMDISNNSTNDDNIPLNIVSNNKSTLKEDIYSSTEYIPSLKQTNSYITTVKRKEFENVTKKTYQDPILTTTSNEAFTTSNAENILEKSTNTYINDIEINSTPIPKICNNQIGDINCFENNTMNNINESTTTNAVDTSFMDDTTLNLLNTDKDYFTLYDENNSTMITDSTDSSDLLKSFTNSYSENKLHDIIPTLPNYYINKILKSFNQNSNGPTTTVNIVADTEKEPINKNFVTETSLIDQVSSGLESAATTLKPSDYFDTMDVKQNISNRNMIQNATTHHLKLVMPEKEYKDETNIFQTGTELVDKTMEEKINTEISDKLAKNKQYDFADKMFMSDRNILNDSLVEPRVTSVNENMSFSDVSINHELLLDSIKIDEENKILRNNITQHVVNFAKEGFSLAEQTTNVETTSENSKPGKVTTTLYPDKILATTMPRDVTNIYFKKSFHDDFVTSYPKHEYTTSSNFASKISDQSQNVVFPKNNHSLSFVYKNIITDNTLTESSESNKDVTTPSTLKTDDDIFTLNEESISTAVVNTTNSSYLLHSSVKFKNEDGVIEIDTVSNNDTINSLTKNVPNRNITSHNSFSNLNKAIKASNDILDNATIKESSDYIIENKVNFIDMGELKAQDSLNLDILHSNLKFYDASNHTNENFNTYSQKVNKPLINTTPLNSGLKFRDLEPTTVKSIEENNNFNNGLVKNFKRTFYGQKHSDYNETNLNITKVVDEHEPGDNDFYNNVMSNKPSDELTIIQFENQNTPVYNTKESAVNLTHEKIINDFQEFKSINEPVNRETVTKTTSNLVEQIASSTLDDIMKMYKNNTNLNEIEAIARSSFDTSTVSNDNKQESILPKMDEESNGKILENDEFNVVENASENAIEISYATTGSLNEENTIIKDKNNYLYKKINTSVSTKNTSHLDENFTKSTVDLIKNETGIKIKSTEILINDTQGMSKFNISIQNNAHLNPQNEFTETQVLPDHTTVIDAQQKHLFSGIPTTDKTIFSTVATNLEKVHETTTVVVNNVHENNTTENKMDEYNGIVLNSTLTNYNQVSPNESANKHDERYISVENNHDILLKTKDLEHTATMLTSNASHKISNNSIVFITQHVSEMFNDSDFANNNNKRDLDQLKIPGVNIIAVTSSPEKEHEYTQTTTRLYDFLLNTPVNNQFNLKGFATTAGSATEIKHNKDVTTYFLQLGNTENSVPFINDKETARTFSNDFSTTAPTILFNEKEDFVSTKSTRESNLNTETRPKETDNKSNESRLITDDLKQAINNKINISWHQAVYENNNKPSNLPETDTFNNVSLKHPSYYIGTRYGEKKNITNINLMKDLLLPNFNLSHSEGTLTKMPKLHATDIINVTYSDSSTYKNEIMTPKNTIKHVATTMKYSNTKTISQITYHNNHLTALKTVNTSSSETRTSVFYCKNNFRGKIADKDNCRKFYICIGNSVAVVGLCPINTVFSDFRKQCTNNLSHCVRNHQFQCIREGRFRDVTKNNVYYICIKGLNHKFIRFKFQCQNGFLLDKKNVICTIDEKMLKSASSSLSSNDTLKNKKLENHSESQINKNFKCEKEGKFVDPFNSRRYYICSKTSKLVLRRRRKKCDSDEVFDNDKNKCVDKDDDCS